MWVIHLTNFKSYLVALLVPFSFLFNFLLLSLTVYHNHLFFEIFPITSNVQLQGRDVNLPPVLSGNTSIFSDYWSHFLAIPFVPKLLPSKNSFFSILKVGFTDPGFVNSPKALINLLFEHPTYYIVPHN